MKRADLGAVLRYNGDLYEVVAINDGYRSLTLVPVEGSPCKHCGHDGRLDLIEQSPLFQDNAEPVKTVEA